MNSRCGGQPGAVRRALPALPHAPGLNRIWIGPIALHALLLGWMMRPTFLLHEGLPALWRWGAVGLLLLTLSLTFVAIRRSGAITSEWYKLSQALDQSTSTVVITDREGTITYANPRFEQTTGYSIQEVLNKTPRILKSGEMPAEGYRELWDTIQSGKAWHGEFHNRRKDGSLYWELASIGPIFDLKGRITHFVAIKEDITARKTAEAALAENAEILKRKNAEILEAHQELAALTVHLEDRVRERTDEVERLLRQKEEIIRHLGHDLKTPLTPLVALLPMAVEESANPKLKEILRLCVTSAQSIQHLVGRALQCEEFSGSALKLNLLRLQVTPLVEGLVESICAQGDTGRRFRIEIPPDLDVEADVIRLRELLRYIIENAIRFSPPHSEITIRARRMGREVAFAIQDAGQGMTPEQIGRAFDEFYKADSSRHDRSSTGLGLALARRIVEKHRGYIWLESPGLGCGTTVHFTLPHNDTTASQLQKEFLPLGGA